MKLSSSFEKMTTPSWKVPIRIYDTYGKIQEDILVDYNDFEKFEDSLIEMEVNHKVLHSQMMIDGQMNLNDRTLEDMQRQCKMSLNTLPDEALWLNFNQAYMGQGLPVRLDTRLRLVKEALINILEARR